MGLRDIGLSRPEFGVPCFLWETDDNNLVWSNIFYIRDSVVFSGTQAHAVPECQSAPGKNQKTAITRRFCSPEKKGKYNSRDPVHDICLFL